MPMNRDLPSFSAIRAFEAAARHLSFKQAAEEICVTDSAVSHQIRLLEDFLGVALFHRETRGVVLTTEGTSYLTKVSDVLDQLASATHDIRDQRATGPLHISSTPAFADRWLVPRLTDFKNCCPGIELHISTSLENAHFEHDGVDAAIRFDQPPSSDLYSQPFLEAIRFPVASPDLLKGKSSLREPGDLRDYVLLHDESDHAWQQWFERAGVGDLDGTEEGPRFAHCNLTLRAAVEGQGVALGYSPLVLGDLVAGRLVRLFNIDLPSKVIYSFVCPKSSADHPRVAAFRQWLTSAAALDNFQAARPAAAAPVSVVK